MKFVQFYLYANLQKSRPVCEQLKDTPQKWFKVENEKKPLNNFRELTVNLLITNSWRTGKLHLTCQCKIDYIVYHVWGFPLMFGISLEWSTEIVKIRKEGKFE